jgi:MSHA biogenesis protein MshN
MDRLLWKSLIVIMGCALTTFTHSAEGPKRGEYLRSFGVDQASITVPPSRVNPIPSSALESRSSPSPDLVEGLAIPELEEDNEVRTARERSLRELDLIQSTEAVRLVEQGQYALAKANLGVYLTENPGAHQTRKTLATVLMASGEQMRARGILETGLELAPNFSPFKKLYARLLIEEEAERAVALLEQVPPDITLDAEYHEIYAVALQMTDQFEAASLVYEVLLQLDDRNANWWMGLAMSRDAVGDFEEAESAYAMASYFGARHLLLNRYGEARLSALRGSP